jgi:anthranilate/para-aminobenzoate synthase component II
MTTNPEISLSKRQQKKQNLLIEGAVIIGVVLIFAVILPLVLPAFRLRLFGRFLSLTIVALGVDLIWGYTGLLSLGHGIFFALGGYCLAMYLNLQLPVGQLPEFFSLYGVNELVDDCEIAALHRGMECDIPVLAVCRGQQVLNVALGGTLVQHLKTTPDHRDTMHGIQVVTGSRLAQAMGTTEPLIHSLHHQAIEKVAPGLVVVGTHQDGTIEAVEHTGSTWIVAVQWHPEDTAREDPSQQGLFNTLISHAS